MGDIVSNTVANFGQLIELDLGQTNLLIVMMGLVFLGISFHGKGEWTKWMACPGWICVGLYFYLGAEHYFLIDDPVLIFMSLAALPVSVAYAAWEGINAKEGRIVESVEWLRGAVFWSAMPYLAIQHIPMLNAGVVWFTAWNTSLMLQWTGAGEIHLGQMMVDLGGGNEVSWSEWGGNRWLQTDTLGEGGFYVPMEHADGDPVNIGFVLGCSALQSMIVFIGAVVALRDSPWKRKARALFITIPVIHVLNVFRNAGIIWMHVAYGGKWDLFGINIFDFGHAYAAKFLSLGAMFIMAIVIFELLPKLHSHVLDVISPVLRPLGILPPREN
ncbi:MAG: archaeosortase A [Candidatus Thalassarchaeaceae archaeon]|jgi:archaeosortase A (PGF-CTERM-specific)|nr:archaeosortase A [Candidatus Thalassarchaeaceae archaeon]